MNTSCIVCDTGILDMPELRNAIYVNSVNSYSALPNKKATGMFECHKRLRIHLVTLKWHCHVLQPLDCSRSFYGIGKLQKFAIKPRES